MFVLVRNFKSRLESCIHWTASRRLRRLEGVRFRESGYPRSQEGDGVISRLSCQKGLPDPSQQDSSTELTLS